MQEPRLNRPRLPMWNMNWNIRCYESGEEEPALGSGFW